MKQDNVGATFFRVVRSLWSRITAFRMDSKLFQKKVRTGSRGKKRDYPRTLSRKAKRDRRTGKNLGSVTSTVGKGKREIGELCDQINSTADELINCMNK